MMESTCNTRSPYQHPGTDIPSRMPEMLKPENLKIDGRNEADLLIFMEKIASQVLYYNIENNQNGNWKSFLERDISVVLAKIASQNAERHQIFLNTLLRNLKNSENRTRPAYLKKGVTSLFAYAFGLIDQINLLWNELPENISLKQELKALIRTRIASSFSGLLSWYKAADSEGENLLDTNYSDFASASPVALISDPLSLNLHPIWFKGFNSFQEFFDSILPDNRPYKGMEATVYGRIYALLTYNLFTSSVFHLQGKFFKTIAISREAFDSTIETWPDHQAHMGLLISFLKTCSPVRNDINGLTSKHLGFYYHDVLGLTKSGPVSDLAFVTVEPVKNATEIFIPKDTEFDGGKDESGRKRVYRNLHDVVINQGNLEFTASVLKTDNVLKALGELTSPDDRLKKGDISWSISGDESLPNARLGFALSSQAFFMEHGNRTLALAVITRPGQGMPAAVNKHHFKAAISGETEWMELEPTDYMGFPQGFYLIFNLGPEKEKVIVPDPEIHGEQFNTEFPVLKIELNQTAPGYSYELFSNVAFDKIWFALNVQGLKDLYVETPDGVVDPSKTFNAFGSQPRKGDSLVIGSGEVFSKNILAMNLTVEWESLDSGFSNTRVEVSYLNKASWEVATGSSSKLLFQTSGALDPSESSINLPGFNFKMPAVKPQKKTFNPGSSYGFMRLKLDREFGHAGYPIKLTEAGIAKANDPANASITIPAPPFTPRIRSLQLDYYAFAQTQDEGNEDLLFFSLSPYGNHSSGPGNLFTIPESKAALYLGFGKINPGETIQLLAMVEEGSANPTKFPAEVRFKYLKESSWHDFPKGFIRDDTLGILKSGIIRISFPDDADVNSTVFQEELLWVAIEIHGDTDSICRIKGLHSRALALRFENKNNTDEHLLKGLEPGTISKMLSPLPLIKKIAQDYPSSEGNPEESEDLFILRTSERLRHKDRAIQGWDYEHLILNQFPSVYHVRCLNHTKSIQASATNPWVYNELAPGNVTLVVVADQKRVIQPDPLKPYVPLSTLALIKDFLHLRLSDHVTYHVVNPVFEELRLNFKVGFKEGITDTTFYLNEVNTALLKFLSPWAFDLDSKPGFGNIWHKSQLISFIESLPYVDFISCFQMDVIMSDGTLRENLLSAQGSTGASILVSVPLHNIQPDNNCNC